MKKAYSRFGFSYTIWALVYTLITAGISIIYSHVTGNDKMPDMMDYAIAFSIRFILIYPLMYLSVRNIPKFEIKQKKLGFGWFLVCVCITYALAYIANLVGMVLNGLIGRITGEGMVNPLFDLIGEMDPIMQLVVVVLLAPVFEELLFRKFLIDRVANYGELTAMLMSGIMFGLYHGNLAQCSYAFAIGCFFAFIYLRTGRIIYTILLHAIVNGLNTCISLVAFKGIDLSELMGYLGNGDIEGYMNYVYAHIGDLARISLIGTFLIVVVILGIIFMAIFHRKLVFEKHEEEVEKKRQMLTAICNPGMIFYLVVWIMAIVFAQVGTSISKMLLGLLK